MTATRCTLLVVALCGALLAGCGGGSTSGSTTTSTQATNSAVRTTSGAGVAKYVASCKSISRRELRSSAGRKAKVEGICNKTSGGAALAQYVAICKSFIQREPTLSEHVKTKAEGTCNKASSGVAARAAAKEVCVEVTEASASPSAFRRKELAACKNS